MRVYLIPIIGGSEIKYVFNNDVIKAEYKGISDTFDFSGLPNGVLPIHDDIGNELVETELELNPIISAKKENEVLFVELLNFISEDATEKEKFPEWIEHTEYVAPVEEEAKDNGTNELEN